VIHLQAAQQAQIAEIVAALLCAGSEIAPGVPVSPGVVAATARRLVNSERGFAHVLVENEAVVGVVLGEIGQGLWCPGSVAQCHIRWVAPSHRGRWGDALLSAFEQWALSHGARVIGVSQTGRVAERYYFRRGYASAERMYLKAVG
jgi:GNAT superfamily N-acetyltransferase